MRRLTGSASWRSLPFVARLSSTIQFSGTADEFLSSISRQPTVVNFYTSWCKPCSAIRGQYEDLALSSDPVENIQFLNVNVEDCEEVSALHDIRSIPTFISFMRGDVVGRVEGARIEELKDMLSRLRQSLAENHQPSLHFKNEVKPR